MAMTLISPAFSFPNTLLGKLQWIESRTGYTVDYRNMPTIRFVNRRVMAALPIANRADIAGSVFGAFRPHDNTILIDDRLLAPRHQDYAATVLLHELVHFVQHHNGTLMRNCSMEYEAYTLQLQFADEHGLDTTFINVENGQAFKRNCEMQRRVLADTIRKLRG
ncbi:MAG: hypothetical protein QNI90_08500 [Dinoroseobacter sp.]|nr:hypothetical protein [Dinoroseobacter sp.]